MSKINQNDFSTLIDNQILYSQQLKDDRKITSAGIDDNQDQLLILEGKLKGKKIAALWSQ
mgnify:CR=1 FL=1